MSENKLLEHLIAEDTLEIVQKAVSKMRKTKDKEPGYIVELEKLIKIYAVILTARKNVGAMAGLKDDELDKLID